MPKLATREACTGCAACRGICPANCIEMETDPFGFAYPAVNGSACIDCGLCSAHCPVLAAPMREAPAPAAYAAWSLDGTIREESSSGGVFSELAAEILGKSGVVYGAAYDDTFSVVHIAVESMDRLHRLRGAKYAQSRMGDLFPEIRKRLDAGQQVLFSGTPCQVAGLKSFLERDPDNLITVDFICHGVPSPMAWKAFVEYRAAEDADGRMPAEINLRSKKTGWSRYRYSNRFAYADGSEYSALSSESLYMRLFVGDYILRSSCGECRFKGLSRVSDITLGDFWGIWDVDPEMDDDKGTSAVLVHSARGRELLASIEDRLRIRQLRPEDIAAQNPSLLRSSSLKPESRAVLQRIREEGIDACRALVDGPSRSLADRLKRAIKRHLIG